MKKFARECISLGLQSHMKQDDFDNDSLSELCGEIISDKLNFYCRSNDDRGDQLVQNHSVFQPKMKNAGKIVFLSQQDSNASFNNAVDKESRDGSKEEVVIEYGRLNDNKALSSVFVLDNIILPLLRQGVSSVTSTQESNLRSSLHLTYAKKFASRVCRFTEQNEKGVRLKVPSGLDLNTLTRTGAESPDLSRLYGAANEWISSIEYTIDSELNKCNLKDIKGPMAEVDLWRRRHVTLSDIVEQCKSAEIKCALEVLRMDNSPTYNRLQETINHLNKLSAEAKENAKFLSTLERHFRTLSDGPLDAIAASLPSLVDGMRMVWAVSRTYNCEERMVPLMEMVANQIVTRVKIHVRLKEIMEEDNIEDSISKLSLSKTVLKVWKDSYLETRAKIECMGQGQRRWEFDRTRLFESTDYMMEICTDILQAVETIGELKQLLCPELVGITGENGNVFNVMNEVGLLPKLLQDIQFDPFDRRNVEFWSKAMTTFEAMVSNIEGHACSSIESAFRKLRSSEGAYRFVQQFVTIRCRPFIQQIIQDRFLDILQQYEKELESIEDHFSKHKHDPPLPVGHCKASGSIAWAHNLYLRVKHPILMFQKRDDLLKSGLGLKLKQSYLNFARSIDSYKEEVFSDWSEHAITISNQFLRKPLLRTKGDASSVADSVYTRSTLRSEHLSLKSAMPTLIKVPTCSFSGNSRVARSVSFQSIIHHIETNFPSTVRDLITETKHFDAMGYVVPEGALHLTLQEQSLSSYVIDLDKFATMFNFTFDSMSLLELSLMSEQVKCVNETISIGLITLNWSSQRVSNFVLTAFNAMENFRSKLAVIRKQIIFIESIVEAIAKTTLIHPDDEYHASSFRHFSEIFESKCFKEMSKCIENYQSIRTILIKIEMAVSESDKGSSSVLECLYRYCSKLMYNALVQMTCRSIFSFFIMLRGSKADYSSCFFHLIVSGKEISSDPLLPDFEKYIARCTRLVSESTRQFSRWMNNTCLDIEDTSVDGRQKYSFYSDVSKNMAIVSTFIGLKSGTLTLRDDIMMLLKNWESTFEKYGVDGSKRKLESQKYLQHISSTALFEQLLINTSEDLTYVQSKDIEYDNLPIRLKHDLCFFQNVNCSDVKKVLKESTSERQLDIVDALLGVVNEPLQYIKDNIQNLTHILSTSADSFDAFETIMNSIASVKSMNMSMEYRCKDVKEKYDVIVEGGGFVTDVEIAESRALTSQWYNLFIHALTIEVRLSDMKSDFRKHLQTKNNEFASKLSKEKARYLMDGPGSPLITLESRITKLDSWKNILEQLQNTQEQLIKSEDVLGMKNTTFSDLLFLQESIVELDLLYQLFVKLEEMIQSQKSVPWHLADIPSFEKSIEEFCEKILTLPKRHNQVVWKELHSKCFNFKAVIPILERLQSDSIKKRHWEKLGASCGCKSMLLDPFSDVSFFVILSMDLSAISDKVNDVINTALQEQKIENGLHDVVSHWKMVKLVPKTYGFSTTKSNYILTSMDEMFTELEDHMLSIQTMFSSKFSGVFRDELKEWEKRLNIFNECLNAWFTLQQKWMYLESIFVGTDDIRIQLPKEAKLFDDTSAAFQAIMRKTHEIPDILTNCSTEQLDIFSKHLESLELCQKSLSEYLNNKRAAFARFYFISDEDLISILGVSDSLSIDSHMIKLFENTKKLLFSKDLNKITHLESSEGEIVQLERSIQNNLPVEVWMKNLEEEIKMTLHEKLKESIYLHASQPLQSWIEENLGMCTITASQAWWTWLVQDAFLSIEKGVKQSMQNLEEVLSTRLLNMIAMTRSGLSDNTRRKVNALLIIEVHARDIVSSFVRESIMNVTQFEWESQLRFYWDKHIDDLIIKQCIGTFSFGYEYLGLSGRLVMTPLTDRCYITLTQALTFKLGGSPSGPAGTGKTETIKDLAKSLGIPCFVTNCGDSLDYCTLAHIFAGIIQTGAWGCFDEFNRINVEVLSVVASQLKTIQQAIISNWESVNIGVGLDIRIRRVHDKVISGVFITMNPGYAGRTELPDNLKSLFRPVAMVNPDILKITENILFSQGFVQSKLLATKIVTLYNIAREQLSKQYHYDFGLRSMKCVLEMAGKMKRKFSALPEDVLMIYVIRNTNVSRFVHDDKILFLAIIEDLFPNVRYPELNTDGLISAVQQYCSENLLNSQSKHRADKRDQVNKILQLYETQKTRHTTMIVGTPCAGKSTILQALAGSIRIFTGANVKISIINPKAQDLNELYGTLDVITRDWYDGIIPYIYRSFNQPLPIGRSNEKRWIVFDGDVDPIWVENLNSVMDDNRLLTLPNGERIRLQPHCSLIFEVYNLQYASPATVSRCGMIWVDQKSLGYVTYHERWLRLRYVEMEANEYLIELFIKYAQPSIEYVTNESDQSKGSKRLKYIFPVQAIELCKQLCHCLEAFLPSPNEESKFDIECLTHIYLYSILFGIGGGLDDSSRIRFNEYIFDLSDVCLPNGNLYDYYFCHDLKRWYHLDSKVPTYIEPNPFSFQKLFVPTKTSTLYQNLLEQLSPVSSILLTGVSGTGKTRICANTSLALPQTTFSNLSIALTYMTNSSELQTIVDSSVEKQSGSIYGAPLGKKLVIFIDDIQMPRVDQYGTRQPLAWLLTLADHGFYYCCKNGIQQKFVHGTRIIGNITSNNMMEYYLDPRFLSKFSLLNVPKPPEEELYHIFSLILQSKWVPSQGDKREVYDSINLIIHLSLKLFSSLTDSLQASPSKFHYSFTMRDLSRLMEGLCSLNDSWYHEKYSMIRYWRNEIHRIFFDRLVSASDRSFADGILNEVIVKEIKESNLNMITKSPMLFVDVDCILYPHDNCTGTIESDYPTLQKFFINTMKDYNIDKQRQLSLVPFDYAIDHLLRIIRILKFPKGHSLLVGVGGSGKKSLTYLASHAMGFKIIELQLSKGYCFNDFCDDVKDILKLACSQKIVFLLSDEHILSEQFMELINFILCEGIPPRLFERDELDTLCQSNQCDKTTLNESCIANLHIVLAMSPSGENLRLRCRRFPSLVSYCIIDWFYPWPTEALMRVGHHYMSEGSDVISEFNIDLENISNHFTFVHTTVSTKTIKYSIEKKFKYQISPMIFIDYVRCFHNLLHKGFQENEFLLKRLEVGLKKIGDASCDIRIMKKQLDDKKLIVDKKTQDLEKLIASIQDKTDMVKLSSEEASNKQKIAKEQGERIKVEKENADSALLGALPAVEAAAEALNNIQREDLQELKAFNNPPVHVKIVCQMCVILRPTGDKLDETWNDSKKMLGNARLLELLKDYPKDSLTEKMYQRCQKVLKDNQKHDISIENMASKSKAGKGLLVWVLAILRYYEVARNVNPLKQKVKEMQKAQRMTEKELIDLRSVIMSLDEQLENLENEYNDAKNDLSELQLEASQMQRRLAAASSLINGLHEEQQRWTRDHERLYNHRSKLIGNHLLFSGFQSYLGAFDHVYRQEIIHEFMDDLSARNIMYSSVFNPDEVVLSKSELQTWFMKGLSTDNNSIQNGVLTMNGSRFPLCIDPQEQALKWIKNVCFESSQVTVKSMVSRDYLKHLELALEYGNTFIFENNGEEIDPILDNLLTKNYFFDHGKKKVLIGDKVIEWNDNFRLFICTKISNPFYTPEIIGKLNLVNYCITRDGLVDQLLNVVVNHERPELEIRHHELINIITSNTLLLTQLEDALLNELSSSTGNILDNDNLISTLKETSTNAISVKEKIKDCNEAKKTIEGARDSYRRVSQRGSTLYFAACQMTTINNMYELSFATFIEQFKLALMDTDENDEMEIRINYLIDSCTLRLYKFTCLGVFERHHLVYAFNLVCLIMEEGDSSFEWILVNFFLKGCASFGLAITRKPENLFWLSKSSWDLLSNIAKHNKTFHYIKETMIVNPDFLSWIQSDTPETKDPPLCEDICFTKIEKLCIFRVFRPDRCYNATKLFILDTLGGNIVQTQKLDYRSIYDQSNASTPILFILSKGADPHSRIQRLGEEVGFHSPHRLSSISLGQGQGPVARRILETAFIRGYWVIIQNCHLLLQWVNELEPLLDHLGTPHRDFRLWLTSEPSFSFPIGLLQKCFKIVIEPPNGMRLNMQNNLNNIRQKDLDDCQHPAFSVLLYSLIFLHAVLQERKKYGKLGWNIPYDFNESDFNISQQLLATYLSNACIHEKDEIPWGSLKYLLGGAMYGGRVSDDFDRRILETYFDEYFGDFLLCQNNQFSFSAHHGSYRVPNTNKGNLDELKNHIENIPIITNPSVIGLNENADLQYFNDKMEDLWQSLLRMSPKEQEGHQYMDSEIVSVATEMIKIIPISDHCNFPFQVSEIRENLIRVDDTEVLSPCNVVLVQELEQYNKLCSCMHSSLNSLLKALKGEIGMSDQLEEMADSIMKGFLPDLWAKATTSSTKKLSTWISNFRKRYEQYKEWTQSGQPKVIWLSGLHYPECFLSALLQTTCRKKGWALDETILHTVVTKFTDRKMLHSIENSMECTLIDGLFLEGASWDIDNSRLTHQSGNDLTTELPIIKLVPMRKKTLGKHKYYRAPVYLTKSRRNANGKGLVFEALLDTDIHHSFWILRGLAIIMNLE